MDFWGNFYIAEEYLFSHGLSYQNKAETDEGTLSTSSHYYFFTILHVSRGSSHKCRPRNEKNFFKTIFKSKYEVLICKAVLELRPVCTNVSF